MRPTIVLEVLVIACAVCCTSAGLPNRVRDVMDKYQKVQLTVPSPPNTKGVFEGIQSAIVNRQFTLRIPPIPFVSALWRGRNGTLANNSSSVTTSSNGVTSGSGEAPTKAGGHHPDWCGGNVLLDLTSRRELTYKSTQFPAGRSTPYACSWDVKVSKSCRRGRVTMRMDGRSRLAHEKRCTKGYYRVSPFMKEAKICGNVGSVPAFHWYVDEQQPEDVTIIMKNIGLNDGNYEGISFTLSGECLNDSVKTDITMENLDLYSRWMHRLLLDSTPGGRHSEIVIHTASMAFMPSSKLSAKASEKISEDLGQAESTSSTTAATSDKNKKPTKITFYSPLYLIFRKLNLI